LIIGLAACTVLAIILSCVLILPSFIVARDFRGVDSTAKKLSEAEFLKAKNDVRTALLLGLGALLVLSGAGIGAAVSLRQLEINRHGQITERFTKAIDQLGNSESVEVRIGGMQALRQIALTSNSQIAPVTFIITAFVQHRSPWPPPDDAEYPKDFSMDEIPPLRFRAPDVQTALDIIGELKVSKVQPRPAIILIACDLRRAAFFGDYNCARFNESNLARASFNEDTDIEGASLLRANLENTHGLSKLSLKGVIADNETRWPNSIDPTASGVVVRSDKTSFGRRVHRKRSDKQS
jgi:hypothetical protein